MFHYPLSNELPQDVFLFGASCAPYVKGKDWPMEEWEQDLKTMKSLHFNTVRIFAAWDRIETEEGVFDYSKQDYLFDLAEKQGMRVIINFGGVFAHLGGLYPPRYIVDANRCHIRMPSPTSPTERTSPQMSICPDEPLYRRKAFEYMERTVKRYAERDNLLAWMIWNEPASPMCYCPHSQANFRTWVQAKYGNIAALNEAWGTEYPLAYRDWEQILAPTGGGVLAMWYDWVRFSHQRLYDTMSEITALTRRCDPRQRPTTSNLVYHLAAMEGETSTPRYGLDVGRVGQSMTVMGVSCYTIEHFHDLGPGYLTAYKLSRLRSASIDENRRMLVLETGVGPNLRMITKPQRLQTFWHLIAHNAKSILLWNYRSRLSDTQVALFHLMRYDGSPSERALYMGEFSAMLQRNAALLNRVYPGREAAILTLEDQQIQVEALAGPHRPFAYSEAHDSRVGAYKLLWDLQIPADCIAENNLDDMARYKLLLLPMCENMTPDLAARIRHYVEEGGTVIAESPFAFRDAQGGLQYAAPAFGLEEVFGCRTRDREGRETAPLIHGADGDSEAYFFWSEYELLGGESLATYANGATAVVKHRFGKGLAIVAGTEVFRQYERRPQAAMSALLQREVLASGAQPTAIVSGDSDCIEVSHLSGEGGVLYIVTNHSESPRTIRLQLRDERADWIEIQSGKPFTLDGEITLQGKEVIALASSSTQAPQ